MTIFTLSQYLYLLATYYCARYNKSDSDSSNDEEQDSNIIRADTRFFSDLHEFLEDKLNEPDVSFSQSTLLSSIDNTFNLMSPACSYSQIKANFGLPYKKDPNEIISHLEISDEISINKYNSFQLPSIDVFKRPRNFSAPSAANKSQSTITCTSTKQSRKSSLELIKNLGRSVMYYRYCVCYFFKHYYKRTDIKFTQGIDQNECCELFNVITAACLNFSKLCHDTKFEYNDNIPVGFLDSFEYQKVKSYEKQIIEENKRCNGQISTVRWKTELKSIRNYNNYRIQKISKNIINTIVYTFYEEIKPYFADIITLETHTDMLLSLFKSLYTLSLFYFENVNEHLQTVFKEIFLNSRYCMFSYCELNSSFLFGYAFNWLYYFSYNEIIKIYPKERSPYSLHYLLVDEFCIQLCMLLYFLYNVDNNHIKYDEENSTFFKEWQQNIAVLLSTKAQDAEAGYIHKLLNNFFTDIKDIYQPKVLTNAKPKDLRILPTSLENHISSLNLDPIIMKYLKCLYKISHDSFIKANKKYTKESLC